MTALDTNVIIDLEEGTPEVSERALAVIERAAANGPIVICSIVYAELCASPDRKPLEIADLLRNAQIRIDTHLPLSVLAEAGAAYGAYARRRRSSGGGSPRRIIGDFLIGAHAVSAGSLVTRDAAFYKRAFPKLRVFEI